MLVVDDHAIVRDGLRAMLESEGMLCQEAAIVEDVLVLLKRGMSVDVVVLDFSLPGADGLEAIPEIHKLRENLPILLFSMHPEEKLAARALRLGAAGYLSKSSETTEVVEAVRAVGRGQHYVSRQFAAQLAGTLHSGEPLPLHHTLSNREFEVLRSIGAGKSVSEVAEILHLSVKTVSTYRERILEKLNMENNYQLIRYVVENLLVKQR